MNVIAPASGRVATASARRRAAASGCASRAARRRHATHRTKAAAVHWPDSTTDARTKRSQASSPRAGWSKSGEAEAYYAPVTTAATTRAMTSSSAARRANRSRVAFIDDPR
jgi:hypothetical protein